MDPLFAAVTGYAICAAIMVALYLWAQRQGKADVADVGWAGCIGFLAIWYALVLDGFPERKIVVALFLAGWSVRLMSHLIRDRVRRPDEDARYAALRAEWGATAPRKFFVYFQVQAVLAVVLTVPLLIIMTDRVAFFSVWDIVATALWCGAIFGEYVSDQQLAAFRAQPENRGQVCRVGLWRYSRHPNYFFEWLHWWSYVLFAVSAPLWEVSLVAPLLMFVLLRYVTGVPPTEARSLASRGASYEAYQRSTNAFFPWFPKDSV